MGKTRTFVVLMKSLGIKLNQNIFIFLLCVLTSDLWGQTRITFGEKTVVKAVSPRECPQPFPYTHADTLLYQRDVIGAYHALKCDSFAVAKMRFEKALKILPKEKANAEIYFELGQMNEREGRHKSAIEDYSIAIQIYPRYIKGLLRRGGMYLLLGETELALKDYDEVLQISPFQIDGLFFRGCTYADMGRYNEAGKDFDALLTQNALDERALYSKALVEEHTGQEMDALEKLNGLVSRFPNNCLYFTARADLEEKMGQMDAADTDWQRALELLPKDVDLLLRRVQFLVRKGDKEAALKCLDKADEFGASIDVTSALRKEIHKGSFTRGKGLKKK